MANTHVVTKQIYKHAVCRFIRRIAGAKGNATMLMMAYVDDRVNASPLVVDVVHLGINTLS